MSATSYEKRRVAWLTEFDSACRKFRQELWKLQSRDTCDDVDAAAVEALAGHVMHCAHDALGMAVFLQRIIDNEARCADCDP